MKKKDWFNPKVSRKAHYETGKVIGMREVLEWLAEENAFNYEYIAWLIEEEFNRKNNNLKKL